MKEIKISRDWLERLIVLADNAKKPIICKKEDSEQLVYERDAVLNQLFGYIESAEYILKDN